MHVGTQHRERDNIMSDPNFDKFVSNQQVSLDPDREVFLTDWRKDLEMLYQQIEGFLKDYIEKKKISLIYNDVNVEEERLGTYTVRSMLIQIGTQKRVTLLPIGCTIIGAKGRVDVLGTAGNFRLVLVDKDAKKPNLQVRIVINRPATEEDHYDKNAKEPEEWAWKIATPPPTISYIALNQESFFQAIMEISNG